MKEWILALAVFVCGCAPATSSRLTAYGVALGDTQQQATRLLGKPVEVKQETQRFASIELDYKQGVVVQMRADQVELNGQVLRGSRAIREGLFKLAPERRGASPMVIYQDPSCDTEVTGWDRDAQIVVSRIAPQAPVDRKGTMDPPGGNPSPD